MSKKPKTPEVIGTTAYTVLSSKAIYQKVYELHDYDLKNREDTLDLTPVIQFANKNATAFVYFCPKDKWFSPLIKKLKAAGFTETRMGRNPRSGNVVYMYAYVPSNFSATGERAIELEGIWDFRTRRYRYVRRETRYSCCMFRYNTYELKFGCSETGVLDYELNDLRGNENANSRI